MTNSAPRVSMAPILTPEERSKRSAHYFANLMASKPAWITYYCGYDPGRINRWLMLTGLTFAEYEQQLAYVEALKSMAEGVEPAMGAQAAIAAVSENLDAPVNYYWRLKRQSRYRRSDSLQLRYLMNWRAD
jgi:hypothetical protein